MSRHEAYIEKNWRELGLAHVVVWRTRGNGLADLAIFLVDCWCLGVKDVIHDEGMPLTACEDLVHSQLPKDFRESLHPACAKKLIEGAIAFAERLGFSPHRDYRKGRRVLSGLDASLCPTDYVFGREGRPCYVPGIDDDDARIDRVLAILDARVGPDGYDFEPEEDPDAYEDVLETRFALRDFLQLEPEEVPRFYAVSGMMTALHIAPQPVPPQKLLETLWPLGNSRWKDQEELQSFLTLFLTYWNYCGELVADAVAPDAPPGTGVIDVYAEDFEEDDRADASELEEEKYRALAMTAASLDWAIGFMQTTQLWPEAWGDALDRADLAPHWEVIRLWSDMPKMTGNLAHIAEAAEEDPPRTLGHSVLAIAKALRRPLP